MAQSSETGTAQDDTARSTTGPVAASTAGAPASEQAAPSPVGTATDTPAADPARQAGRRPGRSRLNRAGIHNVWQYDDHVFRFADGRLLLRGRNGAGKSKALEMLLPFLLDGDARRLDTTGTSRTSLRWLVLDGRTPATVGSAATLGYLWVEFAGRDSDGEPRWTTLGAAVTAVPGATDARTVFFVTDRRPGEDLRLVDDGRPMPIERLRAEVGPDNCYDTPAPYRARVMAELFGLDDPLRYRNLMHLLYRLRRPTIGERLEAGELVSVLAEALPPMDETVLDQVARNISDLDSARDRLRSLRSAKEQVGDFLADYRHYLHGTLRDQVAAVRAQLDAYWRRDSEVARLSEELDHLVAEEGEVQEERDRLRRSRDTAAADAATLASSSPGGAPPGDGEREARYAAVNAYIRAAESAWAGAGYALTAEQDARTRLDTDVAALESRLAALGREHAVLAETALDCGIGADLLGQVPQAVPTTLAPRESTTRVNLEGLEEAVERDPVHGIDSAALSTALGALHDRLTGADDVAAERGRAASELHERAVARDRAARRETALADEAEWCDAALERAREREAVAIDTVRRAGTEYAAAVRAWAGELGAAAEDAPRLDALEASVELPLDDALRVLDPDVPLSVAAHAHAAVDPLLTELRSRRDTAVSEERELAAELDELSERKRSGVDPVPAVQPWAAADRDHTKGAPFYLALEFAPGLSDARRAGLEAALEASGLLSGWIGADGGVRDPMTRDLVLAPGEPLTGRTLADLLDPVEPPGSGVTQRTVAALLSSIALDPDDGAPPASGTCAVATDGRWRLGVASGAHSKTVAEFIGREARTRGNARQLANVDRRIAIAEALLAEAEERRADIERRHAALVRLARTVPSSADLLSGWAALDTARTWLSQAERDRATAARAAETARTAALDLRRAVADQADPDTLPTGADELAGVLAGIGRLRAEIGATHRDLESLALRLAEYRTRIEEWERIRDDRILAEDARSAAISDMITVRRETELTDRARGAAPEQIEAAVGEVRGRRDTAADALPAVERAAQQARDDRVAAETRLDTGVSERAAQAQRALDSGAPLRAMLAGPDGAPDPALLTAAGLPEKTASLAAAAPETAAAEPDTDEPADLAEQVRALDSLVAAIEDALPDEATADIDNSGILRRREELHGLLAEGGAAAARTELTEPAGVKRLLVHDDDGTHDITAFGDRLTDAIAQAEETAARREEEAYERHLLGELAAHLSRQIDQARALIATMNEVLGEVTTSQGLGVRLDWRLAPDADEDIRAVVPLLDRPAEQRTRVETTRLRDALRRCIEAIRRLDPTATGGAQLRSALDYRSWFAFTVYVTDTARPERERRLSHRTALSQGEQRVIAYLVLFAAAAAQFDSLAEHAPDAPRLILLDDAFAKVDEPTHGRLLGLLVELDLDFVLTSERLWGCFASVPSLHIYECLRDPASPGIATLHFTWDGNRRKLLGV
ncbi:uncharacterized protein (TIGR02680 family) [Murinocardiopsis flavida]|uniref:Uncharacterized protein (TIGR02680 family) n=1 Tax=Murinocardiopsis flavida TaxID=645275 RepID=A0A2P8D6P3_9ACTN|nr:TIGR02680 family protein [Murinocardiopsis flavida]PSK92849.1 uncharacterized protein (TIGR02680 family) [Murinocardiopsis flavida]